MTRKLIALACSLTLFALPATSQQVWVVDQSAGPGSDFTDLTTAAFTAADGDIILIRSGGYMGGLPFGVPLIIDGKSLVFIADTGANVGFGGGNGFEIRNLAPSQSVAVRGIEFYGKSVTAQDNLGSLWFEEFATEPTDPLASSRITATNCATVVLNRCALEGQNGFFPIDASSALFASNSGIHLYDTQFQGGIGGGGHTSGAGASAAVFSNSFMYASGSSFQAGGGSPAPTADAFLIGAASEAILLDSSGSLDPQDGMSSTLTGISRSFQANSPVREGEILNLRFEGAPGDIAILNIGANPAGFYFEPLSGSSLLSFPGVIIRIMGFIPPSGVLEKNITLSDLGAGIEGVAFYAQGSFVNLQGTFVGGGSLIVLLDEAF